MKPVHNHRLPWREVDGRTVVLSPQQGEVHELDLVGTFIWVRSKGEKSIQEIAHELSESFEVDPSQAESDVKEFLLELEAKKLIHWKSEAST